MAAFPTIAASAATSEETAVAAQAAFSAIAITPPISAAKSSMAGKPLDTIQNRVGGVLSLYGQIVDAATMRTDGESKATLVAGAAISGKSTGDLLALYGQIVDAPSWTRPTDDAGKATLAAGAAISGKSTGADR